MDVVGENWGKMSAIDRSVNRVERRLGQKMKAHLLF